MATSAAIVGSDLRLDSREVTVNGVMSRVQYQSRRALLAASAQFCLLLVVA
jgi:hypothetical protein